MYHDVQIILILLGKKNLFACPGAITMIFHTTSSFPDIPFFCNISCLASLPTPTKMNALRNTRSTSSCKLSFRATYFHSLYQILENRTRKQHIHSQLQFCQTLLLLVESIGKTNKQQGNKVTTTKSHMVFKSADNEATDRQTRRNKPENKPTLKNI